MLRNRIHRLLGGQHEVKLPQCSDLFGRRGLSFLVLLPQFERATKNRVVAKRISSWLFLTHVFALPICGNLRCRSRRGGCPSHSVRGGRATAQKESAPSPMRRRL
jgi:hypothetical protein